MTNKKTDCGCLCPLFPCLYPLAANPDAMVTRRKKQHSHEIDRQLAKDKQDYVRTPRLLLLGAGESGKSTIIKQMQLIHVEKFSEEVRWERREDIRNNLVEAIVSIVLAMRVIEPPTRLECEDSQWRLDWIVENATKGDFVITPEFYEHTALLWSDKGVRDTYDRGNEFQLIDSAQYFLDKIDLIKRDDYLPCDQDILRCRVLTTGIYELMFQVNNVNFRYGLITNLWDTLYISFDHPSPSRLIDVGGQRDERRKWFLCFSDVTAIIFVTACSSYDMVLREDHTKNRLVESLELFKIVWNNRWLSRVAVILFLNKQDIFREKILAGRRKLEDYFPAYRNYGIPKSEEGEHPEVVRAKYFLESLFRKIRDDNMDFHGNHRLFSHFTCAVDTANIKRVFDDCKDLIQRKHLMDWDLI